MVLTRPLGQKARLPVPNHDQPSIPAEIVRGIYYDILENRRKAKEQTLNPCLECGEPPQLAYSQGVFFLINHMQSYGCKRCGFNGEAHKIYTDVKQAVDEWNADNPKEPGAGGGGGCHCGGDSSPHHDDVSIREG